MVVPTPARFALHKLWLSGQRPAAQQTRAAKDRRQAEALIEVLAADRPGDLGRALAAVGDPRRRQVLAAAGRLSPSLRKALGEPG